MNNLIILTIAILFITVVILLFSYVHSLSDIANYSKSKKIKVFGVNYENVYQVYSNLNFLNELWCGKNITNIDDLTLHSLLTKARSLLQYQLGIGFLIFMLFIASSLFHQ